MLKHLKLKSKRFWEKNLEFFFLMKISIAIAKLEIHVKWFDISTRINLQSLMQLCEMSCRFFFH